MQSARKLLGITLRAPSSDADRRHRFCASDASVDRDGDKINVGGWDLEEWKSNPLFLWSHMRMMPPLAKGVDFAVTPAALEIEVEFAKKGTDYDEWPSVIPSPETVSKMYKGRYLNAVSVGFVPIEVKQYASPEARQQAGLGPYGVEFLRQKLTELSSVTVPSNPNALQLAMSSGLLSDKEADTWIKCLNGHKEQVLDETVECLLNKFKLAMTEGEIITAVRKMLGLPEVDGTAATKTPPAGAPSAQVKSMSASDFRQLWGAAATTVK